MINSVEITLAVDNEVLKEMLIAELVELNFSGFQEDDKEIKAYINEEDFDEQDLNDLLQRFELTYSKSILQDKNWNELWEKDFAPVNVESFCLIRAHFHPSSTSVKHDIIITPKMSFGTGHHATTYLMVQQMQHIDFKNKRVADFGTGTGVLAILAEKLGSIYIKAIDNDDWSIDNAKENFERNGCEKIDLVQKDVFSETEQFDIILANINKNVIISNITGLVFALKQAGILIISGLLQNDEDEILKQCSRYNLVAEKIIRREQWISVRLHFNSDKHF